MPTKAANKASQYGSLNIFFFLVCCSIDISQFGEILGTNYWILNILIHLRGGKSSQIKFPDEKNLINHAEGKQIDENST